MKLIIAGGRNYQFTPADLAKLDVLKSEVREVVSGCAKGADKYGEKWAESKGIPIKRFPPDWATHGNAAGPIRNAEMAQYADAVALFPGGPGTNNMHRNARKFGLKVFDFQKNEIRCTGAKKKTCQTTNDQSSFDHSL